MPNILQSQSIKITREYNPVIMVGEGCPYTTIEDGIAEAVSRGVSRSEPFTLKLRAGVYTVASRVDIPSGLAVVGDNLPTVTSDDLTGIFRLMDGSSLTGVRVINTDITSFSGSSGINIISNVNVSDCIIHAKGWAITGLLHNSTIEGNTLIANNPIAGAGKYTHINNNYMVWDGPPLACLSMADIIGSLGGMVFTNNTCNLLAYSDTTIPGAGPYGIRFTGRGSVIDGNQVNIRFFGKAATASTENCCIDAILTTELPDDFLGDRNVHIGNNTINVVCDELTSIDTEDEPSQLAPILVRYNKETSPVEINLYNNKFTLNYANPTAAARILTFIEGEGSGVVTINDRGNNFIKYKDTVLTSANDVLADGVVVQELAPDLAFPSFTITCSSPSDFDSVVIGGVEWRYDELGPGISGPGSGYVSIIGTGEGGAVTGGDVASALASAINTDTDNYYGIGVTASASSAVVVVNGVSTCTTIYPTTFAVTETVVRADVQKIVQRYGETPASAMIRAAALSPDSTHPVVVELLPGVHTLTSSLEIPAAYIYLRGSDRKGTILRGTLGAETEAIAIIKMCSYSSVSSLTIENLAPNVGGIGISIPAYDDSGVPSVDHVIVDNCDIIAPVGIKGGTGDPTDLYINNCKIRSSSMGIGAFKHGIYRDLDIEVIGANGLLVPVLGVSAGGYPEIVAYNCRVHVGLDATSTAEIGNVAPIDDDHLASVVAVQAGKWFNSYISAEIKNPNDTCNLAAVVPVIGWVKLYGCLIETVHARGASTNYGIYAAASFGDCFVKGCVYDVVNSVGVTAMAGL